MIEVYYSPNVEIERRGSVVTAYVDGKEVACCSDISGCKSDMMAALQEGFWAMEDEAEAHAETPETNGVRAGVDFPATLPGARRVA